MSRTAALLVLLLATSASGVLLDAIDGSGNTSAPPDDPGWIHVGTQGSNTAVYLGDGCVLTASHVGPGPVTLDGFVYPDVPGSAVYFSNPVPYETTEADLVVFAIDPYPIMTPLSIAAGAWPAGTPVVMIGHGRNRGAATSWDENGPPPPGPIFGYDWASGRTTRWGTNDIFDYPITPVLDTWSFRTVFDDTGGTSDEAQVANGDSGGAVFVKNGMDWELAGILFALGEFPGQPTQASFYGQVTYAADLSVYRDDIQDVVCLPEPRGALRVGVLLLLVLRRRRR